MTDINVFHIKLTLDTFAFIGSGEKGIRSGPLLNSWIKREIFSPPDYKMLRNAASASRIDETELPVNYSDKYVIPGSTLKGLSRSRYELYSYPRSCFIISDRWDPKAKTYHELFDLQSNTHINTRKGCKICKLYGSLDDGASKVEFTDAVLYKGEPIEFVDKSHGSAYYLAYPPNSTFKFRIKVWGQDKSTQANILESLGIISGGKRLIGISKFRAKKSDDGQQYDFGVASFKLMKIENFKRNKLGILKLEKPSFTKDLPELLENEVFDFKHAIKTRDYTNISKKRVVQILNEMKRNYQSRLKNEIFNEFNENKFISKDEESEMITLRKDPPGM